MYRSTSMRELGRCREEFSNKLLAGDWRETPTRAKCPDSNLFKSSNTEVSTSMIQLAIELYTITKADPTCHPRSVNLKRLLASITKTLQVNIQPSLETVQDVLQQFEGADTAPNIVPLSACIPADLLTPSLAYLKVSAKSVLLAEINWKGPAKAPTGPRPSTRSFSRALPSRRRFRDTASSVPVSVCARSPFQHLGADPFSTMSLLTTTNF